MLQLQPDAHHNAEKCQQHNCFDYHGDPSSLTQLFCFAPLQFNAKKSKSQENSAVGRKKGKINKIKKENSEKEDKTTKNGAGVLMLETWPLR